MNKPENQPTDWVVLSLGDQAAMPDSEIDTSDIPEDTDWSAAERGKFLIQGEAKLPSTGSNSPTDTSEKGLGKPDLQLPAHGRLAARGKQGL